MKFKILEGNQKGLIVEILKVIPYQNINYKIGHEYTYLFNGKKYIGLNCFDNLKLKELPTE